MFSGTLETNPYSIGHTDPLWIMSTAFETTLCDQKRKIRHNFCRNMKTNNRSERLLEFYLQYCRLSALFLSKLSSFLDWPCCFPDQLFPFGGPRFALRVRMAQVVHGKVLQLPVFGKTSGHVKFFPSCFTHFPALFMKNGGGLFEGFSLSVADKWMKNDCAFISRRFLGLK